MIYKNEGKQIRNEMILWEKNTKYLIGFSFSELLSSGGSNVPTVGTFRFLRHFNLVASGRPFLFSPRLPEPLVVGNWAEMERSMGPSYSVPTTESPLGMVECLEGIVLSSSRVCRRVVPTLKSMD